MWCILETMMPPNIMSCDGIYWLRDGILISQRCRDILKHDTGAYHCNQLLRKRLMQELILIRCSLHLSGYLERVLIDSSGPGQKWTLFRRRYCRIFFGNEKSCILITILLRFGHKCPIDNSIALVQIMSWRRIGDKPLSVPMLNRFADAYMRYYREMSYCRTASWTGYVWLTCIIKPFSCRNAKLVFSTSCTTLCLQRCNRWSLGMDK